MRKMTALRTRTYSFEGIRVTVAASILSKWAAFPLKKKLAFVDNAHKELRNRLNAEANEALENAWQKERALSESLKDVRKINLSDHVRVSDSDIDSFTFTRDPDKLRAAANTLEKAAKKLRERADSIESRPSPLPRGNEELRVTLVKHWIPPDDVCLCWLS
jgi:cell division protein ZapA (FtsZ GTPase activity inhibitor)